MSRLWPKDFLGEVSSLGSFMVQRGEPRFTAWGEQRPCDGGAETAERVISVDELVEDAFARGLEQGRCAAREELREELDRERQVLTDLVQGLEALKPEPTGPLALLLAETVDRLVRQIVGSVIIDGEVLRSRVEAAAALLGEATAPARLRLNPDDIPLLEGAGLGVSLVADPSLERGALVLETGQGWIEDGPAVRLDRLRAELDRMGAPE